MVGGKQEEPVAAQTGDQTAHDGEMNADAIALTTPAPSLREVWLRWRDAASAHRAAADAMDDDYHERMAKYPPNIRHLGLPTFTEYARARDAWEDAAAKARAGEGTPEHGYVAKTGPGFEAVCPGHPSFRRAAWSRKTTPLSSVHTHNAEHHDGAPARVYEVAGRELSTLLP